MAKKSEYDAIRAAAIRRKQELEVPEEQSQNQVAELPQPEESPDIQMIRQAAVARQESPVETQGISPQENVPEEPESSLLKKSGVAAKAYGSRIAGTAGDLQDMLFRMMAFATGGNKDESMVQVKKFLDAEGIPYFTPPESKDIKKSIEKTFPSTIADTKAEKRIEEGVELLADLTNPLTGGTNLTKAVVATTAGMGTKIALENMGLENYSEAGKVVATLVPMLVSGSLRPRDPTVSKKLLESGEKLGVSDSILNPLRKKIASKESAIELYDAGKAAGLTEKQIAPALASEGKKKVLAKTAGNRSSAMEAVKESKSSIGSVYEGLKQTGSKLQLNRGQMNNVRTSLQNVRKEALNVLGGKQGLGPSGKEAINRLDAYIADLSKSKSIDTLINTYQRINEDVNWKSVFSGKSNPLVQAKKSIEEAITQAAPEIGKKFQYANRMYERASKLQDVMEKSSNASYWSKNALSKVVLGAVIKDHPVAAVVGFAGKKGINWLSEQLLLNPKFQNVIPETTRAIAKNSPKLAMLAYDDLKKKVMSEAPEGIKDDFKFD